jgi:hypothetical protein
MHETPANPHPTHMGPQIAGPFLICPQSPQNENRCGRSVRYACGGCADGAL